MITVFKGVNDSLTLLAFRTASAKPIFRVIGIIMLLGIAIAVYIATYTAEFMLKLLTIPTDNLGPSADSVNRIKNYIAIYLQAYQTGDINVFVTISVILMLGSIIFVPFSGYIIHGVVSNSELTTIKNGDNYRIGDSILFQFISSFTFIQLVGLTVIAELLTIDTKHPGRADVFVWFSWVALTLATALLAWIVEYVNRKYGKPVRFGSLGIIAILLGLTLLFDPHHGTTLFGASPHIFHYLQNLANGTTLHFITALVAATALILLIITGIGFVAKKALTLTEIPAITHKKEISRIRTIFRTEKISHLGMTITMMFRYNTVMRPIYTSVGFSIIIALVIGGGSSIATTIVVIPLAIGISFGANMFGLFGNANNWMLSLPQFRNKTIRNFIIILTTTIILSYAAVYGSALVAHRVKPEEVLAHLPSMLATTMAVLVLSILFSIKNPLPFSAKTRENVISSPITLIGYVACYVSAASLFGNVPTSIPNPLYAWAFTIITLIAGTIILARTDYKWRTQEKGVNKVLDRTVNAG